MKTIVRLKTLKGLKGLNLFNAATLKLFPAAALALALTACKPPAAPPPKGFLPQVTVATPVLGSVTNWDEYPGHLEAVEMVEVRPRVSGQIESIHFTDGATVKAGNLLFVIDPRPYQATLERAQGDRQRAQAERLRTQSERQRAETRLELAQNDLKRAEGLRAAKAISEEEWDMRSKASQEAEGALASAKAAEAAADAALAAAKAGEAAADLDLKFTRVTAPIAGRISRRLVTVGNLVQSSGTATLLTTIVSQSPIYCYFDADEGAFLNYQKLSAARQHAALPCELALAGEPDFPHKGRIDFHENQADRKTGTVRMRGVLDNQDGALMPGGFATVRLPVERVEAALLIPEAAIASEQTRKFVYVLDAQQVAEQRVLQLGRAHGAQRVVLAGLKPEERIVVTGLLMLRPGVKVNVVEPKAPAARP